MENRDRRAVAELLRDFIVFFAILFLTCVVGIIELLGEFEKIKGIFGGVTIFIIYFGLVFLMIFGVNKCFWLYEQNKMYKGYGFFFHEIEPIETRGKKIKEGLIIAILVIFTVLYFVKIGVIQ